MILTIYLLGFVIMLVGGLCYVREEQDEVSGGDVFAVLGISVLWPFMVPIALFMFLLEQVGKLISKEKK
jgi:hypothetical protein